jgi:hypothetical protein
MDYDDFLLFWYFNWTYVVKNYPLERIEYLKLNREWVLRWLRNEANLPKWKEILGAVKDKAFEMNYREKDMLATSFFAQGAGFPYNGSETVPQMPEFLLTAINRLKL